MACSGYNVSGRNHSFNGTSQQRTLQRVVLKTLRGGY